MTATDELRRLLDERGVEYTEDHGYREFFWEFGESGMARASAIGTKGLVQMIVTGITPEQAVEATLGRGTCRNKWEIGFLCSECGTAISGLNSINYCPNCGAMVLEPHSNLLGSEER